MKRLVLLATIALLGVTTSEAQVKVDEAGIMKRVEKLQVDSNDPKKAAKAATWLDLGKAYYDAATAPTAGIYAGLDEKTEKLILGKPLSVSTEMIGGREYTKSTYPTLDAYSYNGQIYFWFPTKVLVDNALAKAGEAYLKAYAAEPGVAAAKAKQGIESVANVYKEEADNYYLAQDFAKAGASFANVFELLRQAPVNRIDTLSAFNAGYAYTLASEFEKGGRYLQEAVNLGHESNGDAYYFLFHSYFGQKDMAKAKQALITGITKYPGNTRIVDGLMGLYAETGDDPNEIIPYVAAAIKNDPNNADLYAGMGHIYNKMGNTDASIEQFQKALNLAPEDFGNNFNLGLMLIKKGEVMAEAARNATTTSQAEYNKMIDELNKTYAAALVPLEKAHALDPKDASSVEFLKNIYFRLRDEPGMMEKYEKYNELFKSMQ